MQSSGASSQIQPIKTALVRSLISDCANLRETVYFTRPVVFIYNNSPDSICNIYGIENNQILFDSINPNITTIVYESIPLECLIAMKEEIENSMKVLEIKSKF